MSTAIENKNSEVELARKLRAVDAAYWAINSDITLVAGPFAMKGHEYQKDWLLCDHPDQNFKKGAQIGATEVNVLKTIHGQIHRKYPQGTLYLFPTGDDVRDFSDSRFKPLIEDNPSAIGRYVQNTDAKNIKKIGQSFLFLRGARSTKKIEGIKATSSKLKSIPVDRVIVDEKDEMEAVMVELAWERMSHSNIKEKVNLSTPTIPDYGIDRDYNESDQRIWVLKCGHCGTETCLELEFPNCLEQLNDGRVIRICSNCKNEIYPKDGRWIAQKPHVTDKVGWWISQLNSVYVEPASILRDFLNPPNGNIAEVYNSKLGMAYIAAENRLTTRDVYACCGNDAMPMTENRSCAMGVDVGKILHVVVGYPVGKKYKIIYTAKVSSFGDLYDIEKRFNVRSTVIDAEPETRKAREYQASSNSRVYLCDYQERLKHGEVKDDERGIITVRRTEICDATHDMIASQKTELPRRNPEVEEYAREMSNIAKVLIEDMDTGKKIFTYKKLGDDHYRHATNYFNLACKDGIVETANDPRKTGEEQEYAEDWRPGE